MRKKSFKDCRLTEHTSKSIWDGIFGQVKVFTFEEFFGCYRCRAAGNTVTFWTPRSRHLTTQIRSQLSNWDHDKWKFTASAPFLIICSLRKSYADWKTFAKMYPDWDTLLVLLTKMKKGKICEKRGSYKRNLKSNNRFRNFWQVFQIHQEKQKIFHFKIFF